MNIPTRRTHRRTGTVYLLALALLTIFATLGATLAHQATLNATQASNEAAILDARLAAESGMSYMVMHLDAVRVPTNTTSETLMTNLAAELADLFKGSGDVAVGTISSTSTSIFMPSIPLGNASFATHFTLESDGAGGRRCRMTVTGVRGQARRQASIALALTPRPVATFEYGIASKGRIYISGSALIDGVNTGQEATVFSMSGNPVAIEAGGHATIGGDLFVTSDDITSILLAGGGMKVAGETDIFAIIQDHAHFGVAEPEFPEINITPFAALTTGIIDANTSLPNQDIELNNIRIEAGANPIFTRDTVINGVLYVESPNKVVFTAGTTINGIIVCQDDPTVAEADKQIEFRGHVSAPGVDALPDTAEFAAVKALSGTIVLAPGFGVTFKGATNTINGTIAADQFSFLGNTHIAGDLNGSIIGLKDREMILQGNTTIRINRATDNDTPAGFNHPLGLVVVSGTYSE